MTTGKEIKASPESMPAEGGGEEETPLLLKCDYLVVGAGTSGMSFIDTIITEDPVATVILVDRNQKPGGHWNHAYPYVKLHQPSCYYGVNSLKLGKARSKKNENELYDVNDRATGAEILDYFQKACNNFVATGRVRCFFGAEYKSNEAGETNHSIVLNTDEKLYRVNCRKLVTVSTNVTVPSMRKPLIPVDETVHFVPPNEIPTCAKSGKYTNYIVFGNGKSGIDSVVQLVRVEGIDPSQITWVLGRDIWMIFREQVQDFFGTVRVIGAMESATTVTDSYLAWEAKGFVGRLNDPNRPDFPGWFKGALVDKSEFEVIQSIQTLVRRGRVKSVQSGKILFQNEWENPLDFSPDTTLLVDCMINDFYGYEISKDFRIFEKEKINLGPFIAFFNVSLTSAMIAFLEANVQKGSKGNDDQDKIDARKNECCYFLRGSHSRAEPQALIGAYYMHIKSFQAFMKLKGGMKFLMTSRLNDGAPMHHKGGLWKILWEFYGPNQLYKVEALIVEKVESMEFSDLDHRFGLDSLIENKEGNTNLKKEPWFGKELFQKCFQRRSGRSREGVQEAPLTA